MVLIGTTIAATVSVRRIAAIVSESWKLPKYSSKPFSRAVANTVTSGANSSAARNVRDRVMNTTFTSALTKVRPGRLASSASNASEAARAISDLRRQRVAAPRPAER